jgi:L-lactate utilization protein LutC
MSAEAVKSGPQVGDAVPGPFHPLNVFNAEMPENNGKKACLYCQHGLAPVAMVFTRSCNESVTDLIQKLDAEVAKNKSAKMGAFVVVLTDEEKAAETKLKNMLETKNIKHVSLSIDNTVGPPNYKVAKDAEVTIVLYNQRKVIANHAFKKGDFNSKCIETVIGELPKLLASN